MTIDKRIARLEKKCGYVKGRVPGTQLTRTVAISDIIWTLSLGLMQDRKQFFIGKTIEDCLRKAEKELGLI